MRIKTFIAWLLTASFLVSPAVTNAEIQQVVIKWTPGLCTASCIAGLDKAFKKIDAVASTSLDQAAAQAVLQWKPNYPFSYTPIDYAMNAIGLYVTEFRMKVRGTIIHDKTNVFLVSLGDNTSFTLLSPTIPAPSQAASLYNVESYQLTPQLRERLIATEAQHQVVSIAGPIFTPWLSPPLLLIVESLNIEKPAPAGS